MTYISGTSGPKGPGYRLNPPKIVGNINPKDITLAEALRAHKYKTVHIGKWHLQNHTDKGKTHYPEKHGFDINIAGFRMGQPGSYFFPYKSERHPNTNVPGLEDGKEGDYLTDALTDQAIQFIRKNKAQPFFLNFWYYTVHTPIQAKKEKLKKYTEKARRLGLDTKTNKGIPVWQSRARSEQSSPAYACMVESMDESLGRILNKLKELGIEDNTLVIFYSENGGMSAANFWDPERVIPDSLLDKAYSTSNLPLRGGKGWLYEGGIRVPLIVKWPGKGAQGLVSDVPVITPDIYPTIMEILGITGKGGVSDGVSFVPLLQGAKTLDREAIYWHFPHYSNHGMQSPGGAIRDGDYKLLEYFENGTVQLFNLVNDIGEQNDLSKTEVQKTKELTEKLHQWRKDVDAQMMKPNPDYDPAKDLWSGKK